MIKLLTREVRELIAAGEVVERPASVVKELVENAIDAGASAIEVELAQSGLRMIRVTDNGCGISADEVPTAFLRHATSKVAAPGDLDAIATLGFRGEALAAISAVSRVRFVTRTADSLDAVDYRIEGGEEVESGVTGAPEGTSIYVAELFYNTPARMKFLKKDAYEGNTAQGVVEQLALSHPEIAFRLIREGKTVFSSPGDGDLYSAIYSILPRTVAESMIRVEPLGDSVRVWGYISSPESARASRSMQFVFVNGRFVRAYNIATAAAEGCKNLLQQGRHPSFVLNIELPPQNVDVNVHPAKTEVRFRNDREVFSAVYQAVRSAVTNYATDFGRQAGGQMRREEPETAEEEKSKILSPELAFSTSSAPSKWQNESRPDKESAKPQQSDGWESTPARQLTLEQPMLAYETRRTASLDIEYEPSRNLVHQKSAAVSTNERKLNEVTDTLQKNSGEEARSTQQAALEQPFPIYGIRRNDLLDIELSQNAAPEIAAPPVNARQENAGMLTEQPDKPSAKMRILGELFETYIIAEYGEMAIFIDKHAAHERILFEQLASLATGENRQILLEPAIVTLSQNEKQALLDGAGILEHIGFLVEDFGTGEIAVREVPTYFTGRDVVDAVTGIAAALESNRNDITTEETEWLLHSTACRAAIKAGHKTSREELIRIAADILDNAIPKFCPHGRPVYFAMDKKEMEKRFGRL